MGLIFSTPNTLYHEDDLVHDKNLLRQFFVIKNEVQDSHRRFHSWDWVFNPLFYLIFIGSGVIVTHQVMKEAQPVSACIWIYSIWTLFIQHINRYDKEYNINRLNQDAESCYQEALRRFDRIDSIDDPVEKSDEQYSTLMTLMPRLNDIQNRQSRFGCVLTHHMQQHYVDIFNQSQN